MSSSSPSVLGPVSTSCFISTDDELEVSSVDELSIDASSGSLGENTDSLTESILRDTEISSSVDMVLASGLWSAAIQPISISMTTRRA